MREKEYSIQRQVHEKLTSKQKLFLSTVSVESPRNSRSLSKYVDKVTMNNILSRLHKERMREKRRKHALMRTALGGVVSQVPTRPEEGPPSRESFRNSFARERMNRFSQGSRNSFGSQRGSFDKEMAEEEKLEWPVELVERLESFVTAHAFCRTLYSKLKILLTFMNRKLFAKMVLTKCWRKFLKRREARAFYDKLVFSKNILRPTVRFIVNIRCRQKSRAVHILKKFYNDVVKGCSQSVLIKMFL